MAVSAPPPMSTICGIRVLLRLSAVGLSSFSFTVVRRAYVSFLLVLPSSTSSLIFPETDPGPGHPLTEEELSLAIPLVPPTP